jgi:hypothetical protein
MLLSVHYLGEAIVVEVEWHARARRPDAERERRLLLLACCGPSLRSSRYGGRGAHLSGKGRGRRGRCIRVAWKRIRGYQRRKLIAMLTEPVE